MPALDLIRPYQYDTGVSKQKQSLIPKTATPDATTEPPTEESGCMPAAMREAQGLESAGMKRVYVVGTADTKGEELGFLAEAVASAGAAPLTVDVGTRPPSIAVDVPAETVAAHHPAGPAA